MVKPCHLSYLLSLSKELDVQAERIRNLIGDTHWLSDGHQKEFLLIELLNRHLPSSTLASRGFVTDLNGETSGEQDILIIDTSVEAPLFNQGGIVVSTPVNVLASISVKSTMKKDTIIASLESLQAVNEICSNRYEPQKVWYGAYFYKVDDLLERSPSLVYKYFQNFHTSRYNATVRHPTPADVFCSNDSLLYRVRQNHESTSSQEVSTSIHGYRCEGICTSIFLADLLDHIASHRSPTSPGLQEVVLRSGVTQLDPPKFDIENSKH